MAAKMEKTLTFIRVLFVLGLILCIVAVLQVIEPKNQVFSKDGKYLLTFKGSGPAHLMDISTSQELHNYGSLRQIGPGTITVSYAAERNQLLIGEQNTIYVLDADTGQEQFKFDFPSNTMALTLSDDQNYVAV